MEPLEPINVPLASFPLDEEIPQCCQVLDGIMGSALYAVDLREYTCCTRTQADGTPYDLHLYALVGDCSGLPAHAPDVA